MKYIIGRNMIYYDNKQRYHITKFLHMRMKWIVFNLKLVFGNHIFFSFLDTYRYFYSFILFICTWVHIFFKIITCMSLHFRGGSRDSVDGGGGGGGGALSYGAIYSMIAGTNCSPKAVLAVGVSKPCFHFI